CHSLHELPPDVGAEAVVDRLEPVEVDEQHGEGPARAGGARKRLLKAVAEERAIRELRQAVVERLVRQLLLETNAFGDVPCVQHDASDPAVRAEIGDMRLEMPPLPEPIP